MGVKVRPTPKGLYSIVIVVIPAPDLWHRDGKLTTGEKLCLFAAQCDECGFGKDLQESVLLQSVNKDGPCGPVAEESQDPADVVRNLSADYPASPGGKSHQVVEKGKAELLVRSHSERES